MEIEIVDLRKEGAIKREEKIQHLKEKQESIDVEFADGKPLGFWSSSSINRGHHLAGCFNVDAKNVEKIEVFKESGLTYIRFVRRQNGN